MKVLLAGLLAAVVLPGCPSPGEDAPPDPAACTDAPAWTAMTERCAHEGHVYATASVSKISNESLARSTAINRARAALLGGDGNTTVKNSEALEVFGCPDRMFALVRSDDAAIDRTSLGSCDAAAISARAAAAGGCPEWTTRGHWREGDRMYAVGTASGIRNKGLARTTAENRARSQLRAALEAEVKVEGQAVATSVAGEVGGTQVDGIAECGESIYAQVSAPAP